MINQDRFEALHGEEWARFEAWLATQTRRRGRRRKKEAQAQPEPPAAGEIPHLYRRVCHHLALARERRYGTQLVERLDRMVLGGHQRLYAERPPAVERIVRFFTFDFPRLIRARQRLVWLALALFYLPGLVMGLTIAAAPEMVHTLVDADSLARIESMYDPGVDKIGRERGSDSDVFMFGYYIYNNISIAFRTFAGGMLFGLGTLFYLTFNGLFMGAVAAHLTRIGHGEPFWSFVIGHGAFELTAIALSGAAGLHLGLALLRPGRLRRVDALREAARVSVRIIYGAVAMLVAAAFIEAFWSSTALLPASVKYGVGALLWLLVIVYFTLVGRRAGERA